MQCLEPYAYISSALSGFLLRTEPWQHGDIPTLRSVGFLPHQNNRHIPAHPGHSSELFAVHHAMQVGNLPIDSKLPPGDPKSRMDQEV